MFRDTFKLVSGFEIKAADDGSDTIKIVGYASTNDKDRMGDVILADAWKGGIKDYKNNPIILAYHKADRPIGKAVEISMDEKGLKISAEIRKSAGDIYELIKDGILSTFSVGFKVKDADYDSKTDIFVIKKAELFEISVVSIPANAKAVFSISKSLDSDKDLEEFKKKFIPSEDTDVKANELDEDNKQNEIKAELEKPELTKEQISDLVKSAISETIKEIAAEEAAEELAAKEVADKLAKDLAETIAAKEAEEKEKENMTIETKENLEQLLEDAKTAIRDELKKDNASVEKALEDLRADLAEKNSEIEAMQKSKAVFEERNNDTFSKDQKDTAVLIGKLTGKGTSETDYFKDLITKSGQQHFNAPVKDWEDSFTTTVEQQIQKLLIVEPLLTKRVQMNAPTMYIPYNPQAGTAEWVKLSAITPGSTSGLASSGAEVVHTISDLTLVAQKVATKEYYGFEEEDDSIIAIVPIIRDAVIERMVDASDTALLRGAGNVGAAQGAGYDPITGLTKLANTSGDELAGPSIGAAAKVTVTFLATVRRQLGQYGLNPSAITFLVSIDAYYDLIDDPDFRTMDKVGANATILTGQVGQVGGSPVVVTTNFPAKAAGAVCVAALYAGNFILGPYKNVTVEPVRQVVEQQNVLVSTRRFGFIPVTASEGIATLAWVA